VGRMHGRNGVLLHIALDGRVLKLMWDKLYGISVRGSGLGWSS